MALSTSPENHKEKNKSRLKPLFQPRGGEVGNGIADFTEKSIIIKKNGGQSPSFNQEGGKKPPLAFQ